MKLSPHVALSAALVAIVATPVAAQIYHHGPITIVQPWSRETAPSATTGAGFVDFRNAGPQADQLVSASATIADKVQVHTMSMAGGMMRMRPLSGGLTIPARGQVSLSPSGDHLMFIGLKRPLKRGELVPVTLRFQRAGAVIVRFRVESISSTGPATGNDDHRR